MNAIIKQGGHQYNIAEGDVIRVDLLSEPEGSKTVSYTHLTLPTKLSV